MGVRDPILPREENGEVLRHHASAEATRHLQGHDHASVRRLVRTVFRPVYYRFSGRPPALEVRDSQNRSVGRRGG